MRIAKIKKTDVANGYGIRVSIFVSGCRHACKGCFNSDIWDFKKGDNFDEKMLEEILESLRPEYISGLTLLGGEPLDPLNQDGIYTIVKRVKEIYPNKSIWCYSGYTYEQLMEMEKAVKILELVDVLVDGKFELDLFSLKLKFRGSSNQRVINMVKTRQEKEIVWELPFEEGEKLYTPKSTLI